jgi:hypothetical protein
MWLLQEQLKIPRTVRSACVTFLRESDLQARKLSPVPWSSRQDPPPPDDDDDGTRASSIISAEFNHLPWN